MASFDTVTREELKSKMESDGEFTLIDTLGEESYNRAHLPQAISISAHDDDFVANVEEEVPNKDAEIIVYCASFDCPLSDKAANQLTEAGYSNVVDYEGGLKDWAEGGFELKGEDAQEMQEELAGANEE